jgi:hypothetical protein
MHRELEFRHRLRRGEAEGAELGSLATDWLELGRLEATSRSAAPTAVHKPYASLPAPDLSKTWN